MRDFILPFNILTVKSIKLNGLEIYQSGHFQMYSVNASVSDHLEFYFKGCFPCSNSLKVLHLLQNFLEVMILFISLQCISNELKLK